MNGPKEFLPQEPLRPKAEQLDRDTSLLGDVVSGIKRGGPSFLEKAFPKTPIESK